MNDTSKSLEAESAAARLAAALRLESGKRVVGVFEFLLCRIVVCGI